MTAYQPYTSPTNPAPQYPQGEPYGQAAGQPAQPYPPMGYPQMVRSAPEHPQSTTILVLGILSFVVAGILGPVAWVLGNKAKRECDAGTYAMTDSLRVGRILGIITTILLIVGVVVIIVAVIVMIAVAASYQ